MAHVVKIDGKLDWRAIPGEQPGSWIGICEALEVSIGADSHEELMGLIAETLHLIFEELLESGELDAFLKARGWSRSEIANDNDNGPVDFRFPWRLITEGDERDSARGCG